MNDMKKVWLSAFLSVVCLASWAADSPVPGPIRGRILDGERNPLPGAVVQIDGSCRAAVTDLDGCYAFSNLPEGAHRLSVSYLGFEPVSRELTVSDGQRAFEDILLTASSQELDKVVVNGVFSDQQRAVNRQRGNANITNVVSADQIGKFPDSNIGDVLKRISGINVQYDQGEARFGQVRGTPAEFSSVTLNGSRIPSAEGDIRQVQLDLIPASIPDWQPAGNSMSTWRRSTRPAMSGWGASAPLWRRGRA